MSFPRWTRRCLAGRTCSTRCSTRCEVEMETTPARTTPDQLSVPPDGKPYHEQPQWRNDFPLDWPQDELVARRDFAKFLVLTSFAFVVGQAWIAVETFLRQRTGRPPLTRIGNLDALPVGGATTFDYPGPNDPCILLRTGPDRFLAYSQKCTHLSCAVTPDTANNCL